MGCCSAVLHGWFVRESLFRIGLRHTVDCQETPGRIDEIKKGQWWASGRKIPTGVSYQ